VFDNSTTQCWLFPDIFHKPAVLQFDQRQGSSDGGALLLLKAADRRYGLIAGMADCLRDERQAGKVDHSLKELLAQRVFSIACGYPDANDAARLAADPTQVTALGRIMPRFMCSFSLVPAKLLAFASALAAARQTWPESSCRLEK
jgi:hypothetical protein